ncbi:hypothetical protein BU23DRAFT_328102 [Bimuria novae-zelandiae CBS 107.79]|uniref:Uncharacterized protein n=1 Tax=Bimuria novae-zelandiae CBS 107.79 TaxID=1447943 RepID=A0A6A5URE7_9PLEO|nr:hypothetical protein BU23DRAFT_328102 [Bimuria novae-zelandiae CBS 107.79]
MENVFSEHLFAQVGPFPAFMQTLSTCLSVLRNRGRCGGTVDLSIFYIPNRRSCSLAWQTILRPFLRVEPQSQSLRALKRYRSNLLGHLDAAEPSVAACFPHGRAHYVTAECRHQCLGGILNLRVALGRPHASPHRTLHDVCGSPQAPSRYLINTVIAERCLFSDQVAVQAFFVHLDTMARRIRAEPQFKALDTKYSQYRPTLVETGRHHWAPLSK